MANNRDVIINVTADTQGANRSLQQTTNQVEQLNKSTKNTPKFLQKLGKVGSGAVNLVGKALKATGIVGIFLTLWEAVKRNQVIMDLFERSINAVNLVINPLINAIVDVYKQVSEATNGFEGLRQLLSGAFGTALNSIKVGFYGIKLGIQEVILAYYKVKSVFSDVPTEKIDELKDSIDETKDALKESATAVKDNFIQVVDSAGQALDEIETVAIGVTETVTSTISNLSITAINAQAKALTEAKKALELLDAQQDTVKEKYETQAELLRQIRDDENRSIEERIAANNELSNVLDEQAEKEKEVVNEKIRNAEIVLAADKNNIEAQNQLAELRNQLLEIENRITGQKSEQLTNQVALNNEAKEQLNAVIETQEAIDNYLEEHEQTAKDKELEAEEEKAEKIEQEIEQLVITQEEKDKLLEELADKHAKAISGIESKYAKISSDNIKKKSKDAQDSKIADAQRGLQATLSLAGQESTAGKTAATGSALINTYEGVTQVWKNKTTLPEPFGTAQKVASTAVVLASGLKAVSNIKSTKFATGGIVPGTSFSGDKISANLNSGEMVLNQQQQAELFNMANGNSSSSMSEERIIEIAANVVKNTPVYVVESDITETQRRVQVKDNLINNQ